MAIYKHSILIQVAMFLALKIQSSNNQELYVKVKKLKSFSHFQGSCVNLTNRTMLGLKVTFYERYALCIATLLTIDILFKCLIFLPVELNVTATV